MDRKQFEELGERLDLIIRLLALQLPSAGTLAEKISVLRSAGLKNVQIAKVLGTSEKYVAVALGRAKAAKAKGK